MSGPYQTTYRLTAGLAILLLAVVALLGWFTSVFVLDTSYTAFVADPGRRGQGLAGLPRSLVATALGALTLLVLAILVLQARAAAAGKVLAEIDAAGITHHGLWGQSATLRWGAIGNAAVANNALALRRAPGAAGPRQVLIPLLGQDRGALLAAIRAHRPDLVPAD